MKFLIALALMFVGSQSYAAARCTNNDTPNACVAKIFADEINETYYSMKIYRVSQENLAEFQQKIMTLAKPETEQTQASFPDLRPHYFVDANFVAKTTGSQVLVASNELDMKRYTVYAVNEQGRSEMVARFAEDMFDQQIEDSFLGLKESDIQLRFREQ